MSTSPSPAAPTAAPFDEAAFEAFVASRDEPEWVSQRRREAFAAYNRLRNEPLDEEEWKRVELRAFRPDTFALQPAAEQSPALETLMRDRAEFAGSVVHLDGHAIDETFDDDLAAQGVRFGDLTRLVREEPELLEPHLLTRAVSPTTDRFSAWHSAFWTGGTVLYVPSGVEITAPLNSQHGLAADGAADCSQTQELLEVATRVAEEAGQPALETSSS